MAIMDGTSAARTATDGTGTDGTGDLFSAIERVELALARLEEVVARREAEAESAAAHNAQAELSELKSRHRKLRERVSEELQQLDLLLSSLPQ
ncbi:hypothetical protein J2792_000473 [Novosphingobium capsulatum]|uniref:Cell division protein ZapB n=2 Tax=Novosphingobium TaxID=165696 RepID=A0ABU1MH08_9SPHN|nr:MULTISPECIES: hypothetical protein [Novosphingobium]MBB3654598.1 hypothetical protein [Novosphingobium sp. BK626]KPF55449.1 hypothetical protein IP65_04880 [Novosphingobium sp. AAP1]MBB3360416.1 hypothetical protein [Novosphingobium sp. BK256]MBB3376755.1 hypothetical protein [Novosphingobium sp. BK280]MBB3381168.1 hypothetical protein [Novosphingobium sp. BK258]